MNMEFVQLVQLMRQKQHWYAKSRDFDALMKVQQLEREVDKQVYQFLNPVAVERFGLPEDMELAEPEDASGHNRRA